jgi:hypothetical protein
VKTTHQILAALLGCLVLLAGMDARSQTDGERVRLIMSNLPPRGSPAYQAVKKSAGKATGQALPMTKSEMWSVPKAKVGAVREAAVAHGLGVHELGAEWNHVFHPAPADIKLSPQQKAMIDRVLAAKATQGLRLLVASQPSVVEYALTAEAASKGAPAGITLMLGGGEALTIMRRTVDMKSDMCVWRGLVAGTDSPATIMWWPHGKIAGSVQHGGHLYSIRHLGGEVHALIEMRQERMPDDHPPPPKQRP